MPTKLVQYLLLRKFDEIIRLYETGWSSQTTCDFYDEYEELEKKYLK